MKKNILFLLTAIVVASCTTPKTLGEQYPAMYEEKPVTIAIMPPINQTTHAEAKDYFYTTMYLPLCEKGYYVYSPYLTMEMFQQESAYDAENFLEADLSAFRNVLGADAAMFTIIKSWKRSNPEEINFGVNPTKYNTCIKSYLQNNNTSYTMNYNVKVNYNNT